MTVNDKVGGEDSTDEQDSFTPVYHRYTPHRAGLPPRPVGYFKELWHRRQFAAEMSRANMRSANSLTFFGTAWLVINPLLLAGVYFLMVNILTDRGKSHPNYFNHLALNLFAFYYISAAVTSGANSVVNSGKLLLNTAFPRLLMPLSTVRTAFFRFLPTVPVALIIHLVSGGVWSPTMFLSLYFLACMTIFAMGLAAFFATLQVYFRDTAGFLPYFVRLWMYLSPVLWTVEDVRHFSFFQFVHANPLFSMLGGFSDTIQLGRVPDPIIWIEAGAFALVAAVIGFLFFMSKEREFAVRVY
ncbi:ABC transporter permease [Propionibacteriaceae bacterium Y1685]|uniref:ABC transporter permease n=1 Tax=Microlunatus sp. Y1700 TaxID=3418487 RepID=UPI003B79CD49